MDDKDGVPSAELLAREDDNGVDSNGSKEKKSSSSPPNPLKCAASELASFLLKNRFENDAVATASFLLECTASLPDADEISARLMGGGGGGVAEEAEMEEDEAENDDAEEASSLGEAVPLPGVVGQEGNAEDPESASSSVEVSGAVPRCKFDLSPYEHGIVLTSKRGERVAIGSGSVAHVAMFPKPEDCRGAVPAANSGKNKKSGGGRKRNGSMVLIALKGESSDEQEGDGGRDGGSVLFRNKVLKQVCFQLPQYEFVPSSPGGETSRDAEDEWAELLQSSLLTEGERVIRVANPAFAPQTAKGGRNAAFKKNPDGTRAFRSDEGDPGRTSVTTGGMPYVKCYHGVNDGVVYPLEAGLLFFKPPLFVHRSKLHSISCGRGSSSSGSRYVDLVAVLEDGDDGDGGGERIEFSNINREETRVLNDYIHGVLVKAMARDAADDDGDDDDEGEAAVQEVVAEEEDGEAADDDDDVPGRRKRSRRPASQEARAQIAVLEAKRAAKAPQSGDDHEEEDLDDEDDPEDYCADDDDESDEDDDGLAEDAGVPMVEEESEDDDEDEDDDDFDESEDDDEETESETEEEEAPRPKKKAKKAAS